MPNILELKRRHGEITALVAKALVDEKAGGLTSKQFVSTVNPLLEEADEVDSQIKAYNAANKWRVGGAPGESGAVPAGIGDPGGWSAPGVDSGKRLTFGTKSAAGLANKMMGDSQLGSKALAPSGSAVVDQEFRPDPFALGKPAHSLLDVLPVIPHDTAEFAYMRQNVRTNNAAVVAEGAVKPTSVYSVVRVENKLEVVAHLSEGMPRYWSWIRLRCNSF